jgi:hypothetical protein
VIKWPDQSVHSHGGLREILSALPRLAATYPAMFDAESETRNGAAA